MGTGGDGPALIAGSLLYPPQPGLRTKEEFYFIAVIVAAMSPAILRLLTSCGTGSLTLNRFGILLADDREKKTFIPWNELRSVRFGWISGNLVVRDSRSTRFVIPCRQLGSFLRARRLGKEIRRLKTVYGSELAESHRRTAC